MEKNYIVTIGRSFGSRGREIGEKLAAKLGIGYYDKNLIYLAAEKSGMSERLLENADEKIINRFMDPYASIGGTSESTNERLFRIQSKLIRDIAENESCVIVGRGADRILEDKKNVLKVYIYAPFELRTEQIMTRHDLNEAQAKKLIRQMDKIRRNYYNYFFDGDWEGKDGRDIMIDSGLLGVDGTVDFLADLVARKFK